MSLGDGSVKDAAESDGSSSDASAVDGSHPNDSGTGDSGTDDSGTDDSGTNPDDPDEDGDGYPASRDCDDSDPTIYPGVIRECFSDCAAGVTGCRDDGTWSNCTASTDCQCDTPGATRVVPCGLCGQGSQTCQPNGLWSYPGGCHGEGECQPGTLESIDCAFCGDQGSRLCDDQCQWLPVEGCSGVCVPGEVRRSSAGCALAHQVREEECTSQCLWEVAGPCTSGCLLPPRQSTLAFEETVCVEGGNFTMGSAAGVSYANEEPQHLVTLTPYYIDIYEVSNDRYRQCVLAGACTEPPSWSYYHLPNNGDAAVDGVNHHQATAFCLWDGGALPTEAQWEKAARGPYPRDVPSPWGYDAPTCDLVTISACRGGAEGPWSVDESPAGNSYYGLYNMHSNVLEWVADWYDEHYYAVSPTVDPPGPIAGEHRVTRGKGYRYVLWSYARTVTLRTIWNPDDTTVELGFRCARPGY